MLLLIATFLLAAAFGIGVGVLAWKSVLSTWRSGLAPVALIVIVIISASVFLSVAAGVMKERNERKEVEAAGLALYGRPSSARLHAQLILPVFRDPRAKARLAAIRASGAPTAGLEAIALRGFARLDDAKRSAFFEIRRALADASPDVCAAFWTGQLDPGKMLPVMHGLDEKRQETWIRILAHAGQMELAATAPPARIAVSARDAALAELSTALPPASRAAFERAAATEKPTRDEACAGFQALAEGLGLVAPATRDLVLRFALNPEVVGP